MVTNRGNKMKVNLFKTPFRKAKKHLRKKYLIVIEEKQDGNLFFPIPDEIVNAFSIEIGDVAIFEIINSKILAVKFVKNNMYSLVEEVKK